MTMQAENIQYFFSIMTNFFNYLLQWKNLGGKKTNQYKSHILHYLNLKKLCPESDSRMTAQEEIFL